MTKYTMSLWTYTNVTVSKICKWQQIYHTTIKWLHQGRFIEYTLQNTQNPLSNAISHFEDSEHSVITWMTMCSLALGTDALEEHFTWSWGRIHLYHNDGGVMLLHNIWNQLHICFNSSQHMHFGNRHFNKKPVTRLTYLLSFYKIVTPLKLKPVRHSSPQLPWSCSQLAWRRTWPSQWLAVLAGYPFLVPCNNPAHKIDNKTSDTSHSMVPQYR
jgi:hypothetical protein